MNKKKDKKNKKKLKNTCNRLKLQVEDQCAPLSIVLTKVAKIIAKISD